MSETINQYGISELKKNVTERDRILEEIRLRGFSIIRNVLSSETCNQLNRQIEMIYEQQVSEIGEENLRAINELDVVRCPLYYNDAFVDLLRNKFILELLTELFQNKFILHLQNAIINRPDKHHHQTSWHRDIPYQEYTTTRPLSVNVFYCLSPFNARTGATQILPYSHRYEKFPSIDFTQQNAIYIEANPGDVVVFDSWIYHRATHNTSNIIRYGLNQVFTLPILKQQIDLPSFLNGRYADDLLLRDLLGYNYCTAISVNDFRQRRLARLK